MEPAREPTAPTVVLTMELTSWPRVARTGLRSRESRTSEIMATRFSSLEGGLVVGSKFQRI